MKNHLTRDFPTILVIFGATGDLMKKKIVPSLYDLYEKNALPQHFKVVGFSRRDYTEEQFHNHVSEILKDYKKITEISSGEKKFMDLFVFQKGQFDSKQDYLGLAKRMAEVDNDWKLCANKLFYLAVPPQYNADIFKLLHETELTKPCSPEEGWTRVVVEKPFGRDLKTAEELDRLLSSLFKEIQIYRIDHYLAKEMLRSILTFRFSNNLLEANWSHKSIERIDLKIWESLGVENRGAFYDGIGALRDVGQNHLLQMLALITMEEPRHLEADEIRSKRAELLKQLRIPKANEIPATTFRAQYEGYKSIQNVKPDSVTETYFKVKGEIDSDRWRGVPFFIESGKRMGSPRKEIVVTFKPVRPSIHEPNENFRNRVIFSMEPEEGIKISFWSKKPGLSHEMEERTLDFNLRNPGDKEQYIEEYRKLLLDCINGDQTLFVSTDEIQAMWKFTDPITKSWEKNSVPLEKYEPDSADIVVRAAKVEAEAAAKKKIMPKAFGLIGLGKMGRGMALQLAEKDWQVLAFNRTHEVALELSSENKNIIAHEKISDLIKSLPSPKVVWLMLPAGEVIDEMIFGKDGIANQLKKGDIIVDGGNSFYKDTMRRGKKLAKKGIQFIDVGTSGGPGGARNGACLMIGGDRKTYEYLEPLLKDFAQEGAYQFFEGIGAGHFVKMVHNGIEYGMMQAIAEGFAILKKSSYKLNLVDVARIYNNGSVIESRLVGWLKKGFELHGQDLKPVPGKVGHTGEGLWTAETAKGMKLKAKIIEESYKFRVASAKNPDYAGKILMALREQFGGHKK